MLTSEACGDSNRRIEVQWTSDSELDVAYDLQSLLKKNRPLNPLHSASSRLPFLRAHFAGFVSFL